MFKKAFFAGFLLVACSSQAPVMKPAPIPPNAKFDAGPFMVGPGTELVMCTYVRGANETDADVTSFGTVQSEGGHHLIVYTLDHAVDLPPTPCSQGGQPSWSQMAVSQIPKEDHTFPQGVGFHVKAHQQYVMETHYINTTTAPLMVQSSFTEQFAKPGEVTQRAATYFFGTMNIDIAPHTSATSTSTCAAPLPMGVHTMFAHEHRRGTGLAVELDGQQIYATKLWDAPPIQSFDHLMIGPSNNVKVTCDWMNDTDQRLRFPHEMCFAIGYFWPADNGIFCATGGQNNDKCLCRSVGADSAGAGGSKVEVHLTRNDTIDMSKGDLASGAPIYCALFLQQDWAVFGPKVGAQPKYLRDQVDVPLKTSTDVATFKLDDVTPADYAVTCMMDTIGGGFYPGSGDAVNLNAAKITTVAGQTTTVDVKLDFAIP